MALQKPFDKKLVVAAIDFGTTFSGYAFSFKSDYASDPMKISTPTTWTAGSNALLSLKTPTTLLLNPDKSFRAFGYEAEDIYSYLAEEEAHEDYFYFRRFKMTLFDKSSATGLERNMEIEDDKGKTLEALTVFGMSIKYLKEHFLKTLRSRGSYLKDSDIGYVLTVPAIWTDGSKQFMREAAKEAGIYGSDLMIALEPEAASLFCMHLTVDKMCGSGKQKADQFSKGTKYMVVDAGGGTVDITVHEVVDEHSLKELHSASGGAWGGTRVDDAFTKFIIKIMSNEVFEEFSKHKDDLISLYREFEAKKRNIKNEGTLTKENLRIPASLTSIYKDIHKKTFKEEAKNVKGYEGKIACTGDKLRLDRKLMVDFFKESCDNTVQHVKTLLKDPKCAGTEIILLVGGFAESPLLQASFQEHFKDRRVIIPAEAGLAVLKGAVNFGHNPLTIVSRVAKFSYGFSVYRNFKDGIHPPNKRIQVGEKVKCKDIFAAHVQKGQELKVGESQSSQRYIPLKNEQTSLVFDIFTSTEENPQYMTDIGCQYIGQLEVDLPDISLGTNRGVSVKMIFGGTEVIVEAVEESTNKTTNAAFDFLS